MRVLVVGDIHLKPRMFDEAHKLLEKEVADVAVCLGDLVDDWGEEFNLPLYERTMERAIKFQKDHFGKVIWVMGNHDYAYWHPEFGHRESGHSKLAETDMKELLTEFYKSGATTPKIIAEVDNCLFSHAGVNKNWVERHKKLHSDDLNADLYYTEIEALGEDSKGEALWEEDSPIWWRPQPEWDGDPNEAWGKDKYLQVVGHSPMECPTQQGSILSCDVFSTYRDGAPYGDQSFVIVNTVTKEWEKVEYE